MSNIDQNFMTGAGEDWTAKDIEVEWNIPTTLDGSEAGRVYYIKLSDILIIETPSSPYYKQIAGGALGWNYEFNIFRGSEAEGNTTIRINTKIPPNADDNYSNIAVYVNGEIQIFSPTGDYIIEYDETDPADAFYKIVFNDDVPDNDRIVFIVSSEPRLENFLTEYEFYNFISGATQPLLPIDGTINIGSDTKQFNEIYTSNMRTNLITPMNSQNLIVDGTFESSGDVLVQGNLQVQGNTYTTENTQVTDSSFEIKVSTPVSDGDASYEVQRLNGNAKLKWNDTSHMWEAVYGENGQIVSTIVTEENGNVQTASKLQAEPIITLTGDVNGSVMFDGTEDVDIATTLQTLNGLDVNGGDYSTINVVSGSAGKSIVNIRGFSGGAGQVFVGSDDESGGGLEFNSSTTPNTSGSGQNYNTLYRRYLGSNFWTARNLYTNNNWEFRADVDVGGSLKIGSAGRLIANNNSPTGTNVLGYNGYFYATRVYNAVWNDLAEFMYKAEDVKPGLIVVQTPDGVASSNKRCDKRAIGVHSDSFGYALGAEDSENKIPVGLSGVVWAFIDCDVKIGDEIVSGENGFGIKANLFEKIFKRDCIIGKALEDGQKGERVKILIK